MRFFWTPVAEEKRAQRTFLLYFSFSSPYFFLPSPPLRVVLFRYRGLLAAASAVLDSYPFGGFTTSLDALAVAAPVVTRRHPFLARGRATAALLLDLNATAAARWAEARAAAGATGSGSEPAEHPFVAGDTPAKVCVPRPKAPSGKDIISGASSAAASSAAAASAAAASAAAASAAAPAATVAPVGAFAGPAVKVVLVLDWEAANAQEGAAAVVPSRRRIRCVQGNPIVSTSCQKHKPDNACARQPATFIARWPPGTHCIVGTNNCFGPRSATALPSASARRRLKRACATVSDPFRPSST